MFEFCICDGADTEFCPFHDPRILKMKAEAAKEKEEPPLMTNKLWNGTWMCLGIILLSVPPHGGWYTVVDGFVAFATVLSAYYLFKDFQK